MGTRSLFHRRRRGKVRRRLFARITLAFLAVVALAAAGTYAWLATSLPTTSGRIAIQGITAPVELIRDERGVPSIFAANEHDAIYALGFVHAQDRLFQMDFTRLIAQGRLAEFVGPLALDQDRFIRALDLVRQADAALAALEPRWRELLDAYSAGVNAFLANHSGAWPPEFSILGRTPEPWQPRDALLWGKLMALQLSGNWRGELTRSALATRLSPEMLAELWPDWPADRATTLKYAALYGELELERLAKALPPPLGPSQASNEWVLAGSKTASGQPLLTNDPHLSLSAPGQWYLARIEAPGLRLVGATAPGVPAVILGHNGHIAWGFTTTNADTWDVYVERLDPDDPNRYLTPDGSQPFTTRSETIKVKGHDDAIVTFRSTRHGPVISDFSAAARAAAPAQHVLAVDTPAFHVTDRTPAALFALNRATSWDRFVAALRDWHAPIQNMVYADTDGQIGIYTPGLLPRRKAGDGWMPQPGWTGDYDWNGFVPFEELPHALNPPEGRFVNANNRVVPDDFPVFISRDWDAPFRARRIVDLLDARPAHDAGSMAAILRDSVSLLARETLPRLLAVAPADDESRRAQAMLRQWDGTMDRDRPEPLIFGSWMRELTYRLLADELGEQADELMGEYPALIESALAGTSPFCDDIRTAEREDCAHQIANALTKSLDDLARAYGRDMTRWRWGDAHYAPFRHAVFSRIWMVRDIVGFRVPTNGDYFTINRGAGRSSTRDTVFQHTHGASLRAIYDLADLDRSEFMIAPGQSGNPLSRHWGDLAQDWADGRHFAISGDRARLQSTGSVLILAPH